MILIVGLGNPGKKYQFTRHNIGFLVIENLKLKIENSSDWKYEKKIQAEISKGKIGNQKVILAKPQTFMNLSGKSVKSLIRNWKLEIRNLVVVHDDIDLLLGKIRISVGKGSAGHKGVESIIEEIGAKNFVRFRIGIKPKSENLKNPERFVLQKFNKKEEEIVKEIMKKTVEAIEMTLKEGIEKAMNKYNC